MSAIKRHLWGLFHVSLDFDFLDNWFTLFGSKDVRVLCKLKTLFWDESPSPLFEPLTVFCSFNYFFLHSVSKSSCFLLSDSLPLRLSLSHSICFTDADVLISGKTTGRITTSLGSSSLCNFTHPRAYLSYRLLSEFHLSPPPFSTVSLTCEYKTLCLVRLWFSPSALVLR